MFNVTLNGSGTSVYWLRRKQSCPSALGTSEHGRGSKLYFQNLSGEITQNAEWHMGWCPNRPKECGGLKGILGYFFFFLHILIMPKECPLKSEVLRISAALMAKAMKAESQKDSLWLKAR